MGNMILTYVLVSAKVSFCPFPQRWFQRGSQNNRKDPFSSHIQENVLFLTKTTQHPDAMFTLAWLELFACVAVARAQLVTYPKGALASVVNLEVQAPKATPSYNVAALPYAYGVNGMNGHGGVYVYRYNAPG
ncbi:hypothetical protein TCAL_16322 [Tigriopus californicus]|uniref:Uncharacterized protein n=1 Tax=Tigriopus californicus TaxID=6832 RepID=A0A553N653_TIGCA|nr:hypothetical protein TCAL_16322 [Tigriopus californicus]